MRSTEQALLDALTPGARVYVSAGSAEPLAFGALLATAPERAKGVEFIGSFVPGVNAFDYAGLHPQARMSTLLLPGPLRASFCAGRVDVLPLSYSAFAAHLTRRPPDVAVVHVTPPDAHGMCSLSLAADFAPVVWKQASCRVAFFNPALPRPPGAWKIPASEIDIAVDCDQPAIALPQAVPSPELAALAAQTASLVDDGACIQAGLGGAPGAVLRALTTRRGLVVHSGMISDEVMALAEAGALAPQGHKTGIAIGSPALYAWLETAASVSFVPTPQTHDAAALAQCDRLVAINSALEVDLFGQANLEWLGGRLVSGVGGAPDFIAGARLSRCGSSIIVLPAQARGRSRIVARLTSPTVSIPRNMIDAVVTEHGVAGIGDLPLEPRAQALIGIAAPEHRAELQSAWECLRDSL